jgi:hypothetical protein
MSPFFGSPAFISATHEERMRRLRQFSRLRRLQSGNLDGKRNR